MNYYSGAFKELCAMKSYSYSDDAVSTRGLSFGYSAFNPAPLNNYLAQFGQKEILRNYYKMIGYEDLVVDDPLTAAVSVNYIFPQYGSAGTNDSLRFKIHGWQMMTSIIGFDLLGTEYVDLIIGPQITWGSYHLIKNTPSTGKEKYKEPFVAPGLRLELRFNLGSISIGGRAVYAYDVTDPKWKRRSPNLEILPGYLNRGLYYQAYVGISFN